ncbi:MAG: hypothetical protein RIC81_12415 [Microcella pacifica]|uniref:hypothetical protein n=1 Tax=Microcella pacifica TaxID=2591847 RepID=UPI003314EBB0
MITRSRFGIVAAATVFGVAALGGCTLQAPSGVEDEEARERFVALLDDTQAAAGGSWSVRDDPTPRECLIPLWVTGERFPALRLAEAPVSPALAADRVEEAWRAHDLEVTLTEVSDVIELKGESAQGELLLFRASDSAMTLTGESECRPVA